MGSRQLHPSTMSQFSSRLIGKFRRMASDHLFRRMVQIKSTTPIISFSFDDAPQTAFSHGGDILKAHGARGTYFVSLGMLESISPSGPIASHVDLHRAVEAGHELGCHTFDHTNSWETTTHAFETSIYKNRQALREILPGISFTCFAYPICGPKPVTKRRIGTLFRCCRGGGQTFNFGFADLNLLKAFFLDVRNRNSIDSVMRLIDHNTGCNGWLIFATHDVDDNPSAYGCTNAYFSKVVSYAASSGSVILPVGDACQRIQVR